MRKLSVGLFGLVTILGGTRTSWAEEDAWGTLADTAKCEKEMTSVNGGWISFTNGQPHPPADASADCKAEVDKRGEACQKDPGMQDRIKRAPLGKKDPVAFCAMEAFERMRRQVKKAAEDKAFEAQRQKKMAEATIPVAVTHDPALEKGIAAAYKSEFPDAKIIQVIMLEKEFTTDRNALGAIIGRHITAVIIDQQKDQCEIYTDQWTQEYDGHKYAKKLSGTGGGSLDRTPILCSRVVK